jgi:hypothetical protein
MTVPIVAGLIAVLVILWLVTRNSARVKKEAREDLKREMESLPSRSIMDLVKEEAEETGVDVIPGAEGVDLPIRLKVWHRDAEVRESCPDPALLVFVLTEGVDPERAAADDLRLHFEGYVPRPAEPEAPTPAAEPSEDPETA